MLCATTTSHDVSEQPASFLLLNYTNSRPSFLGFNVKNRWTWETGVFHFGSIPSSWIQGCSTQQIYQNPKDLFVKEMMKHDKHMYFWNVTQHLFLSLFSSQNSLPPSSRSRLSRAPLPGNHIPPATMTSRWIMESFLFQRGSSSEFIMPLWAVIGEGNMWAGG